MNATLCAIRRSTIVQVTKPPLGLWRYHWHELFPLARAEDGNGRQPVYLPEVEPGEGRRALCSRLRGLLVDLPREGGSPVVVSGYMVQIFEGRAALFPEPVENDLDAFIANLSANGSSANGNSANVPTEPRGQRI